MPAGAARSRSLEREDGRPVGVLHALVREGRARRRPGWPCHTPSTVTTTGSYCLVHIHRRLCAARASKSPPAARSSAQASGRRRVRARGRRRTGQGDGALRGDGGRAVAVAHGEDQGRGGVEPGGRGGPGAARAAPVRGPQTAVAVRVRVAAQRAVFGIVCILPLGSSCGSMVKWSAWVPIQPVGPDRRARVCRVRRRNTSRPHAFQ